MTEPHAAILENSPYHGHSIVLFDGVCVMCNRSIRFLLERDGKDRLRFASLQSDFAGALLARHGKDARDLDTVYVVADYALPSERLLSRAGAFRYVFESLGAGWSVLRWLPNALLSPLYRIVVANRYRWFGRYDACPIPTAAERAKFIEDAR